MTGTIKELSIPPDVATQGGVEVLRLFVVEGGLSFSMQRAFGHPESWGRVLAEIAQHAAQVFGRETDISTQQALDAIREFSGRRLA